MSQKIHILRRTAKVNPVTDLSLEIWHARQITRSDDSPMVQHQVAHFDDANSFGQVFRIREDFKPEASGRIIRETSHPLIRKIIHSFAGQGGKELSNSFVFQYRLEPDGFPRFQGIRFGKKDEGKQL